MIKPHIKPRAHTRGDYTKLVMSPFTHITFFFVRNETTHNALVKSREWENFDWIDKIHGAVARTSWLTDSHTMNTDIIIEVRTRDLERGDISTGWFAGTLAHEATHAVSEMFRMVGEEAPGEETRAYYVQFLVQTMMESVAYWYPHLMFEGERKRASRAEKARAKLKPKPEPKPEPKPGPKHKCDSACPST